MKLTPLTAGTISGTGTVTLEGQFGNAGTIGGVLITADGTNDATVTLRKDTATGTILFDIVTKSPIFVSGPFRSDSTKTIYYTISGTGASAMLYEWHD